MPSKACVDKRFLGHVKRPILYLQHATHQPLPLFRAKARNFRKNLIEAHTRTLP